MFFTSIKRNSPTILLTLKLRLMNERQESMYNMVSSLLRFEEIMNEKTMNDELVGSTVIIPQETVEEWFIKIKKHITRFFEHEARIKEARNRPLMEVLLLIKKHQDDYEKKKQID